MTEERRLLGNSEILSDALGSLGTCKRHPNRILLLIIIIIVVVVVIVIVIVITVILICIVNINGNITETGSIKEPISVGVIPILPL